MTLLKASRLDKWIKHGGGTMSATNQMNRKTDYITEYQWAREDPNSFWETQSQAIDWFEPPKTILQTDDNGKDALQSAPTAHT